MPHQPVNVRKATKKTARYRRYRRYEELNEAQSKPAFIKKSGNTIEDKF
jgi:hypothetical protein